MDGVVAVFREGGFKSHLFQKMRDDALVDAVVPGWAGNAWFGPALLVALGVALLAGSIHRDGDAPDDRPAAGSPPAAASAGEDSHATPA